MRRFLALSLFLSLAVGCGPKPEPKAPAKAKAKAKPNAKAKAAQVPLRVMASYIGPATEDPKSKNLHKFLCKNTENSL